MIAQRTARERQDKGTSVEEAGKRRLHAVKPRNSSMNASDGMRSFPTESSAEFDGVAGFTNRQLLATWIDTAFPEWRRLMVTLQFQSCVSFEEASRTVSLAASMRDSQLMGKGHYLKPRNAVYRSFEILFSEVGQGSNSIASHFHGLLFMPKLYSCETEFVPVAINAYLESMARRSQNPSISGQWRSILRRLWAKQHNSSGKPVAIEVCKDAVAVRTYALKAFHAGELPIESFSFIPAAQLKRLPRISVQEFAMALARYSGQRDGR